MMKARRVIGVLLLAASVVGAHAQSAADQSAPKVAKAKHKTQAQLEQDLDDLSDKYEKLAHDMEQFKAEAQRREAELEAANKSVQAAQAAQAETEKTVEQEKQLEASTQETVAVHNEAVASLQNAVNDLKMNSASLVDTILDGQKRAAAPDALHFMGITLKPGGFLAGESVDRQHGIGGDVNTQFSGIPFSAQTAGELSEFNASGRQSRVSLMAEGKLPHSTLRGYYEADFLSAGTTSNDNQSNSYTFRQRQAWAQAELKSNWIFTGGQMWSLATEYKS